MHFSPTISPAPKDEEAGEIESLRKAVQYFIEQGELLIVVQPKYMGSYCDIYLAKNIEESRFFSRRGYPVRIPREELIEAVRPLHERFDWDDVTLRIIQAELMPWSALGKGLIVRDFGGYSDVHHSHCEYIESTKLHESIESLTNSPEFHQYLVDKGTLSKKDLRKKYPSHVCNQYDALSALELTDPETYRDALEVYDEQVELYGQEGNVEFKPFNILKTVLDNGKEWVHVSNYAGFITVSDDEHCIIDATKDVEEQITAAYAFLTRVVEADGEGVIVKPDKVWDKERAPMFKVRNNNYLQMIYGIKFQMNYDYYLRRRGIRKKMRCSINEWNIAQSLLRIPMKDIHPDNEEYVRIVTARILEEDFEATLDSRL
jgi:hypothetical protein